MNSTSNSFHQSPPTYTHMQETIMYICPFLQLWKWKVFINSSQQGLETYRQQCRDTTIIIDGMNCVFHQRRCESLREERRR
jgi:hypothetical protein